MSTRAVYEAISQQTGETIIERKTCAVSGREFAIFQKDREFLDKISPSFAGQKFIIPNPTLDPHERQRRRMTQRNERNYYKSVCALTGKSIITSVDPKLGEPVYDGQVWWGDKRDAMDYGQAYDPTRSFFEQFHELRKKVPKIALMNDNGVGSTNCEYTYDESYGKDIYMVAETINAEHAYFGTDVCDCKFIVDCMTVYLSEYCVECTDSYRLFSCCYVQNSSDCQQMLFARDCKGCHDCIMCSGLRNQSYCILNQQYTKEEYAIKKAAIISQLMNDRITLTQQRHDFLLSQPKLYTNMVNADGCIGNNLFDCADMMMCFDMKNSKNCRYFFLSANAKDCMDVAISCPNGRCYEGVTPDFGRNVCFTTFCWWSSDVWYSEMCHRCKHCFGCVGLKDKEYCIFNVQYEDKDKYEAKVAEIITNMQNPPVSDHPLYKRGPEWGEYFPHQISTYPYNLSDAMSRYPLTRDQALAQGYARSDELSTVNIPDNAVTVQGSELEVNPQLIEDSIINKVIICSESGRPFRIMAKELEIYRKLSWPLPRVHHDVRHQSRTARRLSRDLNLRTCPVTGETLIGPYSSDYPGTVLSTKAYEKLL